MTFTAFQRKIVALAAVVTSTAALLGYVGLSVPRPVWAGEFNALKWELYQDQLSRARKDLRGVKIEEYKLSQKREPVPSFLVEEKLELEDEVKDLEIKVERLEEGRDK
jgi:hypothetical protein